MNQEPGDIIFVPSGWFRVSLSLSDSISYYEQMLYRPKTVEMIVRNTVWNPNRNQFNLAFCYPKEDVLKETGGMGNPQADQWLVSQLNELSDTDYPDPLMNVLTTCAKILKSSGKLSKLINLKDTKCSFDVYIFLLLSKRTLVFHDMYAKTGICTVY